jgi:murein DD-endopeptidase MepM/ murein hydrolase activator NlpD
MSLIPNLAPVAITTPTDPAHPVRPNEAALRQAAAQFESLLLTQLTACLNPKDDDEEALFSNSGGGMGLARQMYSEQLAKTMSESGGIGIADMIMAQITRRTAPTVQGKINQQAVSAARRANSNALSSSAPKPITPASNLNDRYPDAIIISEASSPVPAPVQNSATALSSSNNSRSTVDAVRPRRVKPESPLPFLKARPGIHSPTKGSPLIAVSSADARPMSARVAFQTPLRGEIRSEFGMRRDPINGRMRLHQGIDIAAVRGTPIEAAASGTVVFAGRNKGYGNMVLIEHADGRRTLYAHAQSLFVKAGDRVTAGQTIAAVGSTGHSTGPHLHFEVREDNRSVNPLTALANDIAFARR